MGANMGLSSGHLPQPMDELTHTGSESFFSLSIVEYARLVQLDFLVKPLDQEILRKDLLVVIEELHEGWGLELLVSVYSDKVQDYGLKKALLSNLAVNFDQVDEKLLVLGPELEQVLAILRRQETAQQDEVPVIVGQLHRH